MINLVSTQPINRKRAIYWLHRNLNSLLLNKVDTLSVIISEDELLLTLKQEIIGEILILIESLEEKQTHVIVPTLPKIDILKKFYEDKALSIHWLLIIIEKASLHESTLILKWAFTQFLNLPVQLQIDSYCNLLSTFFIKTLNNSNLYFSPDSINDEQGFFANDLMKTFLNDLFNEFCREDNQEKFMKFLDLISMVSWNSQALLFLGESFSSIKCRSSSLSIDVLSRIGYLCQSNLPTFDLKYRQFISSFFLTGFLNNFLLDVNTVSDFVKILHICFDIGRTVIPDCGVMGILKLKLYSLTAEECQKGFVIVVDMFDEMDLSDSNFQAWSNKIACLSLFISVFSGKIATNFRSDFVNKLMEPIANSSMNPYGDQGKIVKSIIAIQQLHLIDSHAEFEREFSVHFYNELDTNIGPLMKALSDQMDTIENKQCQENYLQLMIYFVKNFPDKMIHIYCKESNSSSPLKIIIGSNIDVTYRNDLKRNVHCLDCLRNCQSLTPLDYEKFNFLSQNIDWVLDEFHDEESVEKLFLFYLELLDISSSSESLIPVLNLIGESLRATLTNQCYDIVAVVTTLVQAAWSRSLEFLSNAQKFWNIYSVFLDKIFHSLLLAIHVVNGAMEMREEIVDSLNKIIQSIFEIGENKFGMVHMLGDRVHEFLMANKFAVDGHSKEFYLDLICQLVLFGPCHRRSLRFENKVDRYLSAKYKDRWSSNRVHRLAESSDRVSGLLILCIDDDTVISTRFRMQVIKRLRDMECQLISNNKNCYKNYINNKLHRTRHRIFSTLLICVKMVLDSAGSECSDLVEEWMLACIEKETLNSIRHFAEWNLILIYDQDQAKQSKLLRLLQSTTDSRPAYVCSMITIARHLVEFNRSGIELDNFIENLVLAILPLGSAQNYNVRLHSMSFISVVKNLNLVPTSKPYLETIISSCISFINRSGTGKNINKLLDNFWWAAFNPHKDVCLETVFSILPQLFELVEEEIISIDQFKVASKSIEYYKVNFDNARSVWKGCQDTVWRVKIETTSDDKLQCQNGNGIFDVQKKIQPWLTSRPDEESLRDLAGTISSDSDIVLVCSLLDKATNIGGLARTSNIFGVGEFVVDNLRVVDDNNFKQLAVTADKWINMTEIPVKSLIAFITVKRMEGFEIVGIEQTANSVALQSTTFNRKTVLILGNEKEGIAAELISHLDRCIEIPQFGQIRSLNVHVTGAIVLWEYMKQMKLSNKSI